MAFFSSEQCLMLVCLGFKETTIFIAFNRLPCAFLSASGMEKTAAMMQTIIFDGNFHQQVTTIESVLRYDAKKDRRFLPSLMSAVIACLYAAAKSDRSQP